MVSGDPLRDFEAWDSEREEKIKELPTCECCGEPIQDEYLYDFDGDLVCEECMLDYVRENFRKKTEDYTED